MSTIDSEGRDARPAPYDLVHPSTLVCPLRRDSYHHLGIKKYFALWIIVAAGIGIGIEQIPHVVEGLDELKVGSTYMLSANSIVAMLVGPVAAVRWNELWSSLRRRSVPLHLTIGSLAVSCVLGPLLMFGLDLIMLNQESELLETMLYIDIDMSMAPA